MNFTKQRIEEIQDQISDLQQEMVDIRNSCSHELPTLNQETLDDPWMSVGAWCQDCGQNFYGWRCKESPDEVCHYFSDFEGRLELINGKEFLLENFDPKNQQYQHEDVCLFCHLPEERK